MSDIIQNHEQGWPSLTNSSSVEFVDLLSRWAPDWAISQAWSENFRNGPDVLLVFDQFDGTISANDIVKSVNNSEVKMVFVTKKKLPDDIFSGFEVGFVKIGPVSPTQRIIIMLSIFSKTSQVF